MLGTFILGAVAGWAAPHAEPRIRAALDGVLFDARPVAPRDLALMSLAVCVTLAAVLSMAIFDPHAVPLALGALAAVFAPRLIEKWRAGKAPDYDS